MLIDARLRLPGNLLWFAEGTEPPEGFAIQGQKPSFKLFYDRREIGRVFTWPTTEHETQEELGTNLKDVVVYATTIDCQLDWSAVVKADLAQVTHG